MTVKNKRGFAKLEWQKLRERNEALDCRVYARAAAWILGADRWSDARWEELAAQFAAADAKGAASAGGTQPARKAQVRRIARSTYMGMTENMADLATLKLRREALTSQRASGVARVSYDGKTVDYRSVAEIDRAIEALDREIAAAEGRRIVRQVRVMTAKGL